MRVDIFWRLENGIDHPPVQNRYEYVYGPFGMNGLSIVPDTIKITQQLAHLPLATLSSLTEIFIPLTRLSTSTWAKGVAQTVKYSVQKQSQSIRSRLCLHR